MFSPNSLPVLGHPCALQPLNLARHRASQCIRVFRIRSTVRIPPAAGRAFAGLPPSSPTSAVEIACPQVQAAQR